MRTTYPTNKLFNLKVFILLFFIGGFSAFSQVDEEDDPVQTDTIGYKQGKLEMPNPRSILEAYTYDPVTDRYIYTNTVDGFNINYPIILTPSQYQELVARENMRKYFQAKSDAIDGKKQGSEEAKRDLLPRYYVNSSFFESIFGSNTIDIKPTGSVEMDLGVRHTKTDNPALSPRNRSNTVFDFDQRISMGLTGKVGTRLGVNINYDTESTFAFQNLIKLEYTPDEDDIIRKIEVGNVSLPLNSSLIRGAQSLFGVKAQLQFGRTTVTGVFSEQKSQTKTVTAQGGGTVQDFELFALDYDSDRHYFLSQYFRNRYNQAMRRYPLIDSRVQITRIEVWVTNRQNRVAQTQNNNMRNILAIQDLGEGQLSNVPNNEIVVINPIPSGFFTNSTTDLPPDNKNNGYNPGLIATGGGLLNTSIREIVTASSGFNFTTASEGRDYSKLENARKLTESEYTFHPQLGYVSLQSKLSNDEVLAVAYQYTIGGEVYQVGEFGTDGVDATQATQDPNTGQTATVSTQSLILKMLRSSLTNVEMPVWDLMMKNIYQIPGAFQLEQDDFRFNIMYTDPSPLNYIVPVSGTPFPTSPPADPIAETPLLKVFNMDRLNYNNDPQVGGDGFFDFLPGLTVDQQYGRIIFTTVEPFGQTLFEKLRLNTTENYLGDEASLLNYNDNQRKYVYKRMYSSTQADALQQSEKNKFQLKGRFKSTGGDGISLNAFNVPQGSVRVTAGGRILVEGVDYTVNYQLGRVQILDPSLQASNTPIEVSVENNSNFGQQTRRFFGVNVEHKFSEKFQMGATYLKMTERPFTQKSNYGQESVNNSIFGVNANYSTEVPFLTRLANKLPNVDTDVPSNVSVRGEVAFLKPGTPKTDQFEGESTLYIDDFEGSQTTIDMRAPLSWFLSSTPENDAESSYNFNASSAGLEYGYKRAKLSWYTIDPIFYAQRPSGVSSQETAFNNTRRIYYDELYPDTDIAVGQSTVVSTLDLTYYPKERGPFNYNPMAAASGTLSNPEENFGGIMRAVNSTNFEQSNVEYIQFWMMDPYHDPGNPDQQTPFNNSGKLYLNLGAISEDILKDGRKQFENGLGAGQVLTSTAWGNVPASQSLIYAFDVDGGNRAAQDVGLDGLNDAEEAAKYPQFSSLADPSGDNYQYYLNAAGNIIERYKNYNGTQGNSPVSVGDTDRGSTTVPDIEDINRDNTMNTINAYYEYEVNIRPGMNVGDPDAPFLVDKRTTQATNLPNGANTTEAHWLLFKIPVATEMVNKIGGISDFRTIQFMRMFMTGFNDQLTLRFGALDLVRGEWRRFVGVLDDDVNNSLDQTNFNVQSLNVQENGTRCPVNYVSPPNVQREQLYQNNSVINQNEQSVALRVDGVGGIEPGDGRAVFKNVQFDFRQFKKLKMFLHAEAIADNGSGLQDNEMVAFIRFGNDFTQNFYEIQIPLKVTQANYNSTTGSCLPLDTYTVWPEANNMDLRLELLTQLKVLAMNGTTAPPEDINGIRFVREGDLDASRAGAINELRIGIKGNPNFGLVRTVMIGLRNNTLNPQVPRDNAPVITRDVRGEVWFNELRLAEMDNKGGWAGVLNVDANMADFMNLSATGRMSTIGFGALEEGPNERSREDMKQYNVVTNMNLGKLLPNKWGMNVPLNLARSEEISTPKYDPFYQDIELDQLLDNTSNEAERENMRRRAVDYTKRSSVNVIGLRKDRAPEQKHRIYDPENLTLSYSYNEVKRHNYEIENFIDQQVNANADYNYSFQPKAWEPLKNNKFLKKSSYWKLLSDFNLNYLPTNITFNTNILRQYNRQQFRNVDVAGIPIEPLYQRNYLFNYQYGFNFNVSKALKVNYNANSSHIVRNYIDDENVPDNTIGIWDDFFSDGIPNQHNQQLVVNYDLPFSKIPVLSFIKTTYSYTGDYSWNRSSIALSSYYDEASGQTYNLGNTIQNAASHKINAALNMDNLYKYLGLVKTKKPAAVKPAGPPKPGEKIQNTNVAPEKESNVFLDGLIGVLTSVKNIQLSYVDTRGTVLPGYLPGLGFFGSSKPTLGFVFGSQDDVRYEAAKRGWLTNYDQFNQNYTEVANKTLDFTANIDLFPDFKIDLNANRAYADNYSEQYDVSPDGTYNSRSPYTYGNYSISTVMLKTSFKTSDEFGSSAFNDFRQNRLIIANRLAENYYGTQSFPVNPEDGYPLGFGKNSQQVLLPAFMSAYTGLGIFNSGAGESAKKISFDIFKDVPIPNWTIKYTGLMRYKFFKDKFKRFSLQSSYRASYTINSFRSNFEYDQDPNGVDTGGNFYSKTIISNVNLVEQFNPLVRVDFEMKNSFKVLAEIKKDRALSMSFDNNLLTEVQGKEYVVGLGYRIKDVIFSTSLAEDPTGVIRSDINIKVDASYRNNKTIVRYLDYDNNQIGGGQDIWSAKLTADYSFSKNLTLIFYYDHQFSKAVISTSFPMTNIRSGFTLRYNFGN